MLNVDDVTSFDEIRAALGVSDNELPDTTLELDMYRLHLNTELRAIDATLETTFDTIRGKTEADRTSAEQNLFSATSLFSLYSVALHLTSSLPLFSPKTITDGKAAISRYADSPYKQTIEAVQAQYSKLKTLLEAALAEYGGSSSTAVSPPGYMGVSSPSFDPVTGS